MKLITHNEFSEALNLGKFHLTGLTDLLMELMKINELNKAYDEAKILKGAEFAEKALELLGIKIELSDEDLKNIPKTGSFIAIANHPYGGIEGLILLKILCAIRTDCKIMGNFLLKKIPSVSDTLVAVNPFENIKNSSSISGIRTTLNLLNAGSPIAIFPAGEVSTYQFAQHQITDKKWHPVVEKLVIKAAVPVLPIYFHGNNGMLFNLLNFVHPALRTAKLPSELFNKNGLTIKVRIGKPISTDEIQLHKKYPGKLSGYVRARTYALGAGLENERKLFHNKYLFKIKKKPREIADEIPHSILELEIDALRKISNSWAERNYELFISAAPLIPNILKEIGRLREKTFREVGEGTNKASDLDRYDIHYLHLFIWDKNAKLIVGAYRIGCGDAIYSSIGKKGFYTAELFKIKSGLKPILTNSLELGRSWVRKEYQQKPLPLFLLWKGIRKFASENPQYRYLIGPVSISDSFSKFSKSLMVDYIYKNHFDYDLAAFVKPRNKFKLDFQKIDHKILLKDKDSLKSLDSIIFEVENNRMKIPVMLRQYIALNAKIICFNIDPKFSDSLDGFLVLDLQKLPSEMMDKLGRN